MSKPWDQLDLKDRPSEREWDLVEALKLICLEYNPKDLAYRIAEEALFTHKNSLSKGGQNE